MIGRSPGFDNFKNMVPKIFALLIYEWVRPMKPIEIDGSAWGGSMGTRWFLRVSEIRTFFGFFTVVFLNELEQS